MIFILSEGKGTSSYKFIRVVLLLLFEISLLAYNLVLLL